MNKEKLRQEALESVRTCIRFINAKDRVNPDSAKKLFAKEGSTKQEVEQRARVWSEIYLKENKHTGWGTLECKHDLISESDFVSRFYRRGNKPLPAMNQPVKSRVLTHFIVKAEVKHAFISLFKGLDLTLEEVLQIDKIKSSYEEFYIFKSLTLEQRLEELRERAGSRVVYFQSERRRVA